MTVAHNENPPEAGTNVIPFTNPKKTTEPTGALPILYQLRELCDVIARDINELPRGLTSSGGIFSHRMGIVNKPVDGDPGQSENDRYNKGLTNIRLFKSPEYHEMKRAAAAGHGEHSVSSPETNFLKK